MSANPAADRNLLFGILALQMDFITRDQLVAGMNAWVLDKARPLGDILKQQGALDAEHHDLLSAMVQAHLKKHNNDAEQSLAAVQASPWLERQIQSLCQPDLEASLAHVAPLDSNLTRSFSVGQSSSAGTRFRIVRPHAEGGLGKVSVALDQELKREVALKEIKERHADDPASRGRFLLEAEITGGLEHPGIVPVYGLGNYADGRPFYAMRFIKGDSLKEAIDRFHGRSREPSGTSGAPGPARLAGPTFQSLEFRQLLGRFVDVCNAIAYAHSRGVLHRDLKPGNIMLGKYGETLVVDWGLAKAGIRNQGSGEPGASATGASTSPSGEIAEAPLQPSGSDHGGTVAGTAVGTPAFMSPEQAAGRLDLLGPTSDVYSLGATLYVLLTGKTPFRDKDTGELLRKVQRGEFSPPRQVNAEVPAPLEAVCRKAMALRAEDRYPTPRAMADDIEHWLADEPLSAWPEPWTVRGRRFVGRHRVLVTGAAAALLVAVISLIAANVLLSEAKDTIAQREKETRVANADLGKANKDLTEANEATKLAYGKLETEKDAADKARKDAEAARDDTEDALAQSRMQLAQARFEEGNAALADELVDQVPLRFRQSAWKLIKNGLAGSPVTLRGHQSGVTSVTFSPDGQTLASGSYDRTVKLWDARTGQELRALRGHQHPVMSVTFSPDGRTLASGSVDSSVKLWDARTGQELRTLHGHQESVTSVTFSPDGQTLASGSGDESVKLWDARTGQELRTLRGHQSAVMSVTFSPDGQTLASGSSDRTVKLWDARTGQELRTLRGHQERVMSVTFSPDGQTLASGSYDQTVKLWDARTGQELRTLRGHQEFVTSVAFSPDGRELYSRDFKRNVLGWSVADGQPCRVPLAAAAVVGAANVSPDGKLLAVPSGTAIHLIPRQLSASELRFRLRWRQPDPGEHEHQARQADQQNQAFAAACRLGHAIHARLRLPLSPWDPAAAVHVASTGLGPFTAAAGLSALEDGRRAQTAFVDGPTFAGILLKDSGRSSKGLVLRAQWAVDQWPEGWRNREVLGGALYRDGDYQGAVRELMHSQKLRGQAMARSGDRATTGEKTVWSCHFQTLAHHKLGNKDDAAAWRAKAVLPKDANWEDAMIDRYLRREVEAELK